LLELRRAIVEHPLMGRYYWKLSADSQQLPACFTDIMTFWWYKLFSQL
jgi:hypothetical protein